MNVNLPPDQQALIDQLVAAGRFASTDEAIREGVRLLVSQEKVRAEIQIGIDQADRGELTDHDSVFAKLRATAVEIQRTATGQ